LWLGKRLVVRLCVPILTTDLTLEQELESGAKAVTGMVREYVEPQGRKPLSRWLTGLF